MVQFTATTFLRSCVMLSEWALSGHDSPTHCLDHSSSSIISRHFYRLHKHLVSKRYSIIYDSQIQASIHITHSVLRLHYIRKIVLKHIIIIIISSSSSSSSSSYLSIKIFKKFKMSIHKNISEWFLKETLQRFLLFWLSAHTISLNKKKKKDV